MPNQSSKSNEQYQSSTTATNNSKMTSSTTTYHTLNRTWPSQAKSSGQAEERQPNPKRANMKFSLERWAGESMREQPWNGIGQFAKRKEAERHHVGGEEGSDGGEAGSEANSDDA